MPPRITLALAILAAAVQSQPPMDHAPGAPSTQERPAPPLPPPAPPLLGPPLMLQSTADIRQLR